MRVCVFLAGLAAVLAAGPCDPLVPEVCSYPFPNNYWLVNGTLSLGVDTFPKDRSGQGIDVNRGGWNNLDGFSPVPGILTYFPNLNIDNCPRLWNIAASLQADSPTALIDTSTGELVPHWVELDHSSDVNHPFGYERTMMIWPAHQLKHSTRYVVGLRKLVNNDGEIVSSSTAFAALRDNIPSGNPDVESRRAAFNSDVFPVLEQAGFARGTLQLAWDFTVMSKYTITNRIVTMRDDALARTASGIKYRIDQVHNNVSSSITRKIQGRMTIPWYLNQVEPGIDVRVVTEPGKPDVPVFNGFHEVSFTVLIPKSIVANRTTGAIMQYGHGLFGDQSEVDVGYLDDEANEYGYVLAATDWIGLSQWDVPYAAIMIASDLSNFAMIPDRCHQGMLNALMLMRLVSSPQFVNDPNVVYGGQSVIDPTRRYYYGNSQGGILGTVYMGVTTDVPRGVIGVGGAPYALLLPRSADFADLFDILKVRYSEAISRPALMAMIQLLWNRMDPAGYLSHVSADPLPNTPAHRIITHYGVGDAQVSWLGMYILARSVNASMYSSNVRVANETLFGFNYVSDNTVLTEGNLIQGWRFTGVPNPPLINIPPDKATDTHERPRRTKTAQAQTHRFLATGEIYNACGGPCVDNS
eukprot:m.106925 g.106925  ORF g.106925 m.106925 type:complete len:638 (+) comp8960_c0_seq3:39-1952(+)